MHNCTSRKIEGAHVSHPSANAPYPMGKRVIDNKSLWRICGRIVRFWIDPTPAQSEPFKPADQAHPVRAEGEGVANNNPLNSNKANEYKALHYRAEHILFSYQAAIEESEARYSHEHYQCGRDKDKGCISGIDLAFHLIIPPVGFS